MLRMFMRLFLVFTGSVAFVYLLRITRIYYRVVHWIYGYRFHDKIAHIVVGAVLAILLIWCLYPYRLQIKKIAIPAGAILLSVLVFFDELLQMPLPGRDANPLDFLASLIGILVGLLLYYAWEQAPKLKVLLFRKEMN